MRKSAFIVLMFLGTLIVEGQTVAITRKKSPGSSRPVCSPGAICFSGEVREGKTFRYSLSPELEFVLESGWTITVVPKHPEGECTELASVVNAPYRAHRALYIDTSYGWTAEDEVSESPREFRFVTNCADFRTESKRLGIALWGDGATEQEYNAALAKLGTSRLGTGRLWITDSKITHTSDTADDKLGKIQWMRFTVEIELPQS